ncbi:protein disulfide oxidoreductase [Endozoicomonas arenosclerae]|uniref:protein disulfide oxidoreductase n=1 Tax=Endozoicomonas arenosclerae TaxID=1633495 RepID=UPI000783BC10|nr:protein disulfide oxidoreductase [Endozoicomonas arenosclerae]
MSKRLGKIIREAFFTLLIGAAVMTAYNTYLQKDMPTGIAPELRAMPINGEQVDLRSLSEKGPVLLYFWASWCRVCHWVSPAVSDLSENYQVVTVALASGDNERVAKYLGVKELRFPVINDHDGSVSRDWNVSVTPSIFVIRNGEIETVTTGFTTKLGMLIRLWLNS